MDILQEIVAHKRIEVERFKQQLPPSVLYAQVEQMLEHNHVASMRQALLSSDSGIIAEFKRRSPSKGWIKANGRPDEIPLSYERHGAAAISILTDESYFGGSDDFICIARDSGVQIPILYKNFIVDEYQLFQARKCGASAVLLIAADLSFAECRSLNKMAHELGLEVLLEMHSEDELDYVETEPDMYGVNNRHLGSFVTDVQSSFMLASRLPADGCKVSESGLSDPETVKMLRSIGYNGFLMGEHFMKMPDPGLALQDFITHLK